MIRQLDPLLSLPATDLPRAVRFYTEVLGLTPVVEAPEVGFYIFSLAEGEGLVGLHQHPGPMPAPDPNGVWCWLRTPALESMIARLRHAGSTILDEPSELGPGRQQAFLDTEGNVLRLYEPIDRLERTVDIDAPIQRVFDALVTAQTIERWFSRIDNVVFEGRAGGNVSFIDPVFGNVTGTVQRWDPPRGLRIEFTENWPTSLEYELASAGAGTRLTVRQHGFAPIRNRDFGIPELIEQLDAALVALKGGVA